MEYDIRQSEPTIYLVPALMSVEDILSEAATMMSSTVYSIHGRAAFLTEYPEMVNNGQLKRLLADLDDLYTMLMQLESNFDY